MHAANPAIRDFGDFGDSLTGSRRYRGAKLDLVAPLFVSILIALTNPTEMAGHRDRS